jgi:FkbM family methyltransferase
MNITLKRLIYAVLPPAVIDRLKVRLFYKIFDQFQEKDFPETVILERLLSPGDTVIDVGSNIGLVTKLFANIVGDAGKVHSFEPVPYTYKILTRNIGRAGFRNVCCYDSAISDQDGTATIVVPTFADTPSYAEGPDPRMNTVESFGRVRNYYAAQIQKASTSSQEGRISYAINTRSLDSLFADDSTQIHFIKCDAEGFEFECMIGGKTIIERDRPPLYIELCSDPDQEGSGMWRLNQFLATMGYAPYLFEKGQLQKRPSGKFAHDLFYLTESQFATAVSE